eukprot:COSAG02_NODE_4891_length_4859_cov_3.712605_1_plen_52_part_00
MFRNELDFSRWRYGIVRRNIGKLTEFECPYSGETFVGNNGIRVNLPPGVSA